MTHKAGFVNIIGNPNVGKSTLINTLTGERLSIITNKVQTTRHRILGIVNEKEYQIVFSDTPGVIKPSYTLQESMMYFVKKAFEDADIILYMVEVGEKKLNNEVLFKKIMDYKKPVLLLINKIDKSNQDFINEMSYYWKKILPNAEQFFISALEKFNTNEVLQKVIELLPESLPFYPKDQLTDRPERFFVNEKIREKILIHFKKEIPYSVEVRTESLKRKDKLILIESVIIVERDSQKGIIIGHKGKALKRIGIEARKDLELFFGSKIYLNIFVRVNKNWRNDKDQLKRFGYE